MIRTGATHVSIVHRHHLAGNHTERCEVKELENKWVRAAIPAILIHISVGTVYCWSTFKTAIAEKIGMSSFAVGWAFSFAIFFLGMSAAFAGKFVEKDIHKSSLIACVCFSAGMIGTGLSIQFLTGIQALIGIYLSYGAVMGIGLGVGYITPVKTLMLWFSENKGLATGISIMGFGLAKAIATPVMSCLVDTFGIVPMFYILGPVYFCLMFVAHLLLKKPDGWVEKNDELQFDSLSMFSDKVYLSIWVMFFLNIHCGLMIISYERQLLKEVFGGWQSAALILGLVPSLTAVFNAAGRLGYSTLSDKLRQRVIVYWVIFFTSYISILIVGVTDSISLKCGTASAIMVVLFLLVVNAGYGGGFSTLPALLSERYGMDRISQLHGLTLSAWAVAGITGNNTTAYILNVTGHYEAVLLCCWALYVLAFGVCIDGVWLKNNGVRK